MDLDFIYSNELEFVEKTRFVLNFNSGSAESEIKEIVFSKDKDYFITSMKWFLKIQRLNEDLANYKDIKELSYTANKITDAKKIDYKIDEIDYIIDTRGYKNERKTLNFVQKHSKLYNEKLKFYNFLNCRK